LPPSRPRGNWLARLEVDLEPRDDHGVTIFPTWHQSWSMRA
jgi:hypothetical protein